MVPQIAPCVKAFFKLNSGMIISTPKNVIIDIKTSISFGLSLEKRGSIKVIKIGKVENVRTAIATLEI